jgi:hypothetical protein
MSKFFLRCATKASPNVAERQIRERNTKYYFSFSGGEAHFEVTTRTTPNDKIEKKDEGGSRGKEKYLYLCLQINQKQYHDEKFFHAFLTGHDGHDRLERCHLSEGEHRRQ